MKLSPETAEGAAITARAWAESATTLPLILRKITGEDSVGCLQMFPLERFTKGDFARALGYKDTRTLDRVLSVFGVTSARDGRFDAETVDFVRRQLKLDEGRKTPHELRLLRRV